VLDFGGRILLGFDMIRVSAMESVIFGMAGLFLLWASRREREFPRVRKTEMILSAVFGVAALRAGVWAWSGDVFVANLAVLSVIVAAAAALAYRRRRGSRRQRKAADATMH
jgi:asparagine N-glycosylation enzyme membrane subunit Stt3